MQTKLFFKSFLITSTLCLTNAWSQTNLVQNGTCDDFNVLEVKIDNIKEVIGNTGDNADGWDMTPNSTVINNTAANAAAATQESKKVGATGATSTSPYKFDTDDNPTGWNNGDLDTAINTQYSSSNEQPATTGDGTYVDGVKTRGLKLSSIGRRIYQLVQVTAGTEYTFSVDTRSEAANANTEVFILNTEIASEAGIDVDKNSATNTVIDAYQAISDENSSKGDAETNTFTNTTFSFTATNNSVVIYMRALGATNSSTEVFVDNISLIENSSLSTNEIDANAFNISPNPATDKISISTDEVIDSVELFDMLGKNVSGLTNGKTVDVSSLASGIYFVKIASGNNVAVKRIVKK